MRRIQTAAALLAASLMTATYVQPVYAKNISKVSLTIDADMYDGMPIGEENIDVDTSSNKYHVLDVEIADYGENKSSTASDEWIDNDDDDNKNETNEYETWDSSYAPIVKITLEAEDSDDKFKSNSANDFTIKGNADAEFVSASTSKDTVTLKVKLQCLATSSSIIDKFTFEKDDEEGYVYLNFNDKLRDDVYVKLQLYKDNKKVGSYTSDAGDEYFDFTNLIKTPGTYKYKAQTVLESSNGKKLESKWVTGNDSVTISESDIVKMTGLKPQYDSGKTLKDLLDLKGPSSDPTLTNTEASGPEATQIQIQMNALLNNGQKVDANTGGDWKQDEKGWKWVYSDKSYTANAWKNVDNKWYRFDENGYMVTGWKKLNEKWYYLHSAGDMATGWRVVDGKTWYLDPNSGEMATGWIQVDGTWFYMDKTSGEMLVNQITPDGYQVGADGKYIPAS